MVANHSAIPSRFFGVAVAILLVATGTETLGSVVNSATRAEQTAFNPAFEGLYASVSTTVGGEPGFFNGSLTHLWGPYYAASAHQMSGLLGFGEIFLGSDYVNNPGPPTSISRVDVSPDSDLAIITAVAADNSPRPSTSKLVGITVAGQGGAQDSDGGTIINFFATVQNLQFINNVTSMNISMNDILSGNSIFAAPQVGMLVRGKGFGVWGNFSGSLNNPDGKAGEYWSSVDSNKPYLVSGGYDYANTNFYVLTKRTLDPLGGIAEFYDSGSPVITIIPEAALRILGIAATNGSVTIQWESQNGKTYRVQSKDAVIGTWQYLGNPIHATGSITSYADTPPVEVTQRFYRVVRQ